MSNKNTEPAKKRYIKWGAVLWYIHLHVLGVYATWLLFTSAKWMTVFFTISITIMGCLGVTVGAHRLWAHRAFEASTSLRLFLMLAHTLAGVGPIYDWVLYHRLHHKYYGTDKDPYNHKKGFLYSHYISNFLSPTLDYEQMELEVDMRDMQRDRFVIIQKKLYWLVFGIFGLLLPLNAPLEYWNETMAMTVLVTGILRFAITVNVSWLVNSALLVWSTLDTDIVQGDISIFFISRSYWPAYHYKVPWDWKTDEFGKYGRGFNTFFVKMWYELGLITNRQTASTENIRDILHQITKKKFFLDGGLEKLKKISDYEMRKETLSSAQ